MCYDILRCGQAQEVTGEDLGGGAVALLLSAIARGLTEDLPPLRQVQGRQCCWWRCALQALPEVGIAYHKGKQRQGARHGWQKVPPAAMGPMEHPHGGGSC